MDYVLCCLRSTYCSGGAFDVALDSDKGHACLLSGCVPWYWCASITLRTRTPLAAAATLFVQCLRFEERGSFAGVRLQTHI